jgi:hypothetical protein
MMKLKLALVTAIVVATTSMAAAQTYIRQAPPWYAYYDMDHADAAGSPPGQHRNPGENGGG